MNFKIKWLSENVDVEISSITRLENKFRIQLPQDYIDCITKNDGGYPQPNRFTLNGNEEVFNNLLTLDETDSSSIFEVYNDVKDRLIDRIIPIAEDPFGNLICLDYRNSVQPTLVFWDHEVALDDKEAAISYLCESFTTLISMLQEPRK